MPRNPEDDSSDDALIPVAAQVAVDAGSPSADAPEPAPGPEGADAPEPEATSPAEPVDPYGADGSDAPALMDEPVDKDAPEDPDAPIVPTETRLLRRLLGDRTLALDATPRARLLGWLWPLAVTAFAAVVRLWDLGRPHQLVFDETYYVKQAYSLLQRGYEAGWGDNPNPKFEAGDMSSLSHTAEYVVHPPVGKWIIALGIQLGGGPGSSTAWRLGAAVAGILSVLMIARIARRLFASTALGTTAGLLLAIDGTAIVQSRVSLLDGFVMFFALAGFGALLIDREQARRRLARRAAAILDSGADLGWGPRLGWRWWRLAAGILLGLCIGTKWSGLYFLAVFGVLSVAWDATARRAVGVRAWPGATLVRDAIVAGTGMVSLAFATYVGTWWSWFASSDGYLRQWAVENPGMGVTWLPPALRSLWKFHTDMWYFHNHLTSPHAYAASPLGWIVQWRPTSYYYPSEISGLTGDAAQRACGASSCSQAITSLGNPLLWWTAAAALIVTLVWIARFRDWRGVALLSGIAAGWLPWFAYAHRTIFTFYSIAFTPWVVLTLTYVLGLVVGEPGDDPGRRRVAIRWVAGFVALLVLVSAFFYPIWAASVIPYWFWHDHMWLRTWI